MKQKVYFIVALVALTLAIGSPPDSPADSSTPIPEVTTPPDDTAPATGFRAYVDPVTREFSDAPVFVDDPARPVEDVIHRSAAELEERPSVVEGGGIVVDLQGRFQNTAVATINGDGTVSAPCLPACADHAGEHLHAECEAKISEGGDDR